MPDERTTAVHDALRRAASRNDGPGNRAHVERLLTDGAAAVFQLEHERLEAKRQSRDPRDVEAQIEELRELLGVVRRRFTRAVPPR